MVTTSESNSASTSQSRLSALSATLPSNPTSSTSPLVASLPVSNVPPLYTTPPLLPNNSPPSRTTRDQAATVECVLPFITGTSDGVRPRFNDAGVPPLAKQMHVAFARDSMERLPAPYVGYDAARPWLVYWSVAALASLGCLEEQVPGMVESGLGLGEVRQLRDRAVATFSAQQVPTGGFGGSHGHLAHLAPTYAAVLSLSMLSGLDDDDNVDTLAMINRKALWEWLGEVKQADGGFRVCVDGEEDVRGAYCAMTIISLLNLPLTLPPNCTARTQHGMTSFTDNLKPWLASCQTYEGGISGTPDSEAHGAYAFCVLGCLSLLGDPRDTIPEVLDVDLLVSWLSSRQYAPEGGFSGRTNKLVDACYSHWVGGCWPLLEAAVFANHDQTPDPARARPAFTQSADSSLYDREGLARYILCCCQDDDGGLRDKPGKLADAYHTCYTLAGLSAALHYNGYQYPVDDLVLSRELPAAFGWRSVGRSKEWMIGGEEATVNPVHPVFVVPFEAVERARVRFRNGGW